MRKLSLFALVIAYAHTVLGAIVRISGSGMGCGEHWPDCNSEYVPTLGSTATIIEFSHRMLAATLVVTLVVLAVKSKDRGPALLALGTTVVAALLGALIVALSLSNPYLIAVHYALAMLLLATLVVANVRAGNFGAPNVQASERTMRSTRAGAILAFVVVVMGALVANVPGAAPSCQGFPLCRSVLVGGVPFALHIVHRSLAFLLFGHLFAVALLTRKRHEGRVIILATRLAFSAVVFQIIVAATMVELHLPAPLQSLHQAVGTLVWITAMTAAALADFAVRERALELDPRPVLA
ncbi:MAG TPA: COX15/CtaA family protein [Gemmatimonadaceae bacterium]|nr:COX15/CtaA family protein [Gemmatimonadaceae bacterium]